MSLPGEFNQAIIAYQSDDGVVFTVSQKLETALALNNPTVFTRGVQGRPEMYRLRTITVMTVRNFELFERKLVVASPDNPMFTGDVSTVTISGWIWKITGRKGEKRRGPYPASKG
jgi:hypothetical protein